MLFGSRLVGHLIRDGAVLGMEKSEAVTGTEPEVSVEVKGVVKWFDTVKGFGFIIPDNDSAVTDSDILLHLSCLKQAGHDYALEGASVICEAVERTKGWQAITLISMDESTAVVPPPRTNETRSDRPPVEPTSDFEDGEIKWFNRAKGYGFVTCGPDAPDLFLHMETLRSFDLRELKTGDKVRVRYGKGAKGMMVAEIELIESVSDDQ